MRNAEGAADILGTLRAGQSNLRNRWPLTNQQIGRELGIRLSTFLERSADYQFRLIEPTLPTLRNMQRNWHNQHRISPKI
jgi:hypothetical protein